LLLLLLVLKTNPLSSLLVNPSFRLDPREPFRISSFPIALRGGRTRTSERNEDPESESNEDAQDEVLDGQNDEAQEEQIVGAEQILPQLKGLGINLRIGKDTPENDIASEICQKVGR
jgi:hypothetical protein